MRYIVYYDPAEEVNFYFYFKAESFENRPIV